MAGFTTNALIHATGSINQDSIPLGTPGTVPTTQPAGAPLMTYPMAITTGVIKGGVVTINANPALVDISAGYGAIEDWTDVDNPVMRRITWDAETAVPMPNLATGVFTTFAVVDNDDIVPVSGVAPTPQDQRIKIYLQTAVHTSGTQIDSISGSSMQAYQVINALFDYVTAAGPINSGNAISANGANLQINRASGTTTLPFINRINDPQSPSELISTAASPVASFNRTYQDSPSGFITVPGQTTIDPNFWDDGTGTLNSVANNRFTTQRVYYFAQTDSLAITYGQAEYTSIDDAVAAIFSESPAISPFFSGGKFVTAIIVQEGTTDLTNASEARFVFEG